MRSFGEISPSGELRHGDVGSGNHFRHFLDTVVGVVLRLVIHVVIPSLSIPVPTHGRRSDRRNRSQNFNKIISGVDSEKSNPAGVLSLAIIKSVPPFKL